MEEEDKVFSKLLLTKCDETENYSSSRIFYYGRNSGAVPFLWESQPGTPKHHAHTAADHPHLPLTPPPNSNSRLITTTDHAHNLFTPNNNNNIKNNKKKSSSLSARLLSKLRSSAHHHHRKSSSSARMFRGCYPVRHVFWATLRGRRQPN